MQSTIHVFLSCLKHFCLCPSLFLSSDHTEANPLTMLAEGLEALFCFCEWTSWSSANLRLHTGVKSVIDYKTHVDLTTCLNNVNALIAFCNYN